MPQSDQTTTVEELKLLLQEFVDERNWQKFHNPKNLSMALTIEAGELMEHFQWLTLPESHAVKDDAQKKQAVEEEVADCLAYVLSIANAMDIDLSQTLHNKMIKNRKKYPAP